MDNFQVFKETLKNLGYGEFAYYSSARSTDMLCPTCNGEKSTTINYWGKDITVKCPTCSGIGTLSTIYTPKQDRINEIKLILLDHKTNDVTIYINGQLVSAYHIPYPSLEQAQKKCDEDNGFSLT